MIEPMAKRNYLVEGVSGTGKSSVCNELRKRGYKAVNGNRERAYQGDSETGNRTDGYGHEYHIWDVGKVREIAANKRRQGYFSLWRFTEF
jgi:broad-specificity NMP kinase